MIETLIILILALLLLGIISVLFFAVIGLFIFVQVFMYDKKQPMDKSNRVAHLRLIWFAISRPEIFAPYFNWLRMDEFDLVKNLTNNKDK